MPRRTRRRPHNPGSPLSRSLASRLVIYALLRPPRAAREAPCGTAAGKTGNLLVDGQGNVPTVEAKDLSKTRGASGTLRAQRILGISTPHAGGVFGVALADGSSTFLSRTIQKSTLAAMCTRNASDTVGDR